MESETGHIFQSTNLQMAGYAFFRKTKHDKAFCDVTFDIGDKTVSGHRIVIAAAIPYYQRLWLKNNGADEKIVDENGHIIPDCIDPGAFENLIEFAYTGKIMISDENVRPLLGEALRLDIKEVSDACCDFLGNSLNAENVFEIRNFACDLKCFELLKDADTYMCENFGEISQKEELCSLSLQCLGDLLDRDDLRASSEEKVFRSVMKWVNNCPEQRKADLPELLKKVRMTFLDPRYLKDCVASEHLIHESIPCRDLLDEARNYHLFPDDKITPSSFPSEPRCKASGRNSPNVEESMYVLSASIRYTAQQFSQEEQNWKTKVGTNFFHLVSSSAVVGTKIYYFHENRVMEYDPLENVYKNCKELKNHKFNYRTASVNGKIYLCGGQNSLSHSKTVQCFDPEKNTWENISDMRERRSALGVTVLGECIYVLGGTNGSCIHKSVEKYDLRYGKWRSVPSMLTERKELGCATLKGQIYACGGLVAADVCSPTAEVYDPMENKWMLISPVNTLRRNHRLVPYRGKVFAIGGKDANGSTINSVEVYDPNSNKWKFGKEVSHNHFVAAAEVISGNPL